MSTSTVNSKGQTTIPRDVREAAGLKAGDNIHFTVLADRTIILRIKNRISRDLAVRPKPGRHVTIEQMNR